MGLVLACCILVFLNFGVVQGAFARPLVSHASLREQLTSLQASIIHSFCVRQILMVLGGRGRPGPDRGHGGGFRPHEEALVDFGRAVSSDPLYAFFLYDLKLIAHPRSYESRL